MINNRVASLQQHLGAVFMTVLMSNFVYVTRFIPKIFFKMNTFNHGTGPNVDVFFLLCA